MKKEDRKKIVDSIDKIVKSFYVTDIITFFICVIGIALIKIARGISSNQGFSEEIRLMYLLFIALYIVLMLVLLSHVEMIHLLERIERKIEKGENK